MALNGFTIYHSYLKAMEPYSDAACGRLLRACIQYSMTGDLPDLKGNERFLFPIWKAQIDQDKAKYVSRCEKNRENIKTRWNTNVYDRIQSNTIVYERIQSNTNVYDRIENEKNEEKQGKSEFEIFLDEFDKETLKEEEREEEKEAPPLDKKEKNQKKELISPLEKEAEKEEEIIKEEEREAICFKENGVVRVFYPPSVEEVAAYCRSRNNFVDPQRFVDSYASKGWRVGRHGMKDWQAAVRTWERSERKPEWKQESSVPRKSFNVKSDLEG